MELNYLQDQSTRSKVTENISQAPTTWQLQIRHFEKFCRHLHANYFREFLGISLDFKNCFASQRKSLF